MNNTQQHQQKSAHEAGTVSGVLSLHTRLLVVIIIPLIVVTAIMTAWRYQEAKHTTQQIYDTGLLSIAHVITRDVVLNQGDLLAERLLDTLRDASGDRLFYHLIGEQRPILLSGYTPSPKAPQRLTEAANQQPVFFDSTFRNEPIRAVYFREHFTTNAYNGWVKVTVWQNTGQRERLSFRLAGRALTMLLIVLLATAVIVWFGVTYGLKPLLNLQQAIAKRSPDDLSPIKRAVPREVSSLVAATNHLLGQVQQSIVEKDAFIANAAHQLRNPIAGLLSQAEAAERTRDDHLLRERVSDVTEAARRTARLTQQLLSMERISQGALEGAFENFDIVPVVRERLAHVAARAHQLGVEISLQANESPAWVYGNPLLMGEVLDNLLDNALRYGCPNQAEQIGQIITCITPHNNRVAISINDNGPGLPETLLPRLFERFTRGTEDGAGGCGLGLAISQSIIVAHGGSITVAASAEGACFTIALPLRNQRRVS